MNEMNVTRRSGLDLRVLRVKADIKVTALAKAMKTTASGVSRVESSRNVTPEMEARYLNALASLASDATPPEAA